MSQPTASKAKNSLLQSEAVIRLLGADVIQLLKCGICLEFFNLPIVLPCGHTFCLHCLTEMCQHASRGNNQACLQDVRIACPNCRVLIYATPVLERNVTCNFIVQSLIELLKAREGQQIQNTGVNTDEVRIGPKIRTLSDCDVARLIQDLDRMTEALGRRNVVDNAYFEIDEIRRTHLAGGAREMADTDTQTRRHSQASDRSSTKPQSHLMTRPPSVHPFAAPTATSQTQPKETSLMRTNSRPFHKPGHPTNGIFYHQYQFGYQQQPHQQPPHQQLPPPPPPPPPQHWTMMPNQQHHRQSRNQAPQLQQSLSWAEKFGTEMSKNNMIKPNTTRGTTSHSCSSSNLGQQQTAMLPGGLPRMSQTSQKSLLAISSTDNNCSIGFRMATTGCSSEGNPDVGQPNRKRGHQQETPICNSSLDNDPAVMSFVCSSSCATANHNPS